MRQTRIFAVQTAFTNILLAHLLSSNLKATCTDSEMSKKILVIGNGSREHVLAWKLAQSDQVSNVYVSPANGGIKKHGGKITALGMFLFGNLLC